MNTQIHQTLINSVIVGTGSSLLAGIIGVITAYGFVRHQFRYQDILAGLMILPMIISPVVIGVGFTAYMDLVGLPRNYLFLILGHTTLVLPFVFIAVQAQLSTLDISLEEAAQTLGANELETFIEITFPLITPSVVTGVFLAFIISFGEFTATQFWTIPQTETAPILIFSLVQVSFSPVINALSVVLIIISILIPIILIYIYNVSAVLRN